MNKKILIYLNLFFISIFAFSQNSELILDEKLKNNNITDTENADYSQIIKVINRTSRDIYSYFHIYMLATLIDPLTLKAANDIRTKSKNNEDVVKKISSWVNLNMTHTQNSDIFKDKPGKDPWGTDGRSAINKKVLPPEMKAKTIYTRYYMTGKCCAFAAFIPCLFILNGCSMEDVVALRLKGHNVALVKFNDNVYLINNKKISDYKKEISWIKNQDFLYFFDFSGSVNTFFMLNDNFFQNNDTLIKRIYKYTDNEYRFTKKSYLTLNYTENNSELYKLMFNSKNTDFDKIAVLTRYAYQSLYVNKPEYYLEASILTPVTIELSKELTNINMIFDWIKDNVNYGSIFEDYQDRIMTSDEVIVFKKGGYKDQAVLVYSLLKLNGYNPQVLISKENSYVSFDNKIYDIKLMKKIDNIKDKIEIILAIK